MWDRFGPEHEIDCSEDMTRLTFDTIGLCAFGYRFNEFYSEKAHPFAKQLRAALLESGRRGNRPPIVNRFYYRAEQERQENIAKMGELSDKIVKDRIVHPKPEAHDLLNFMLNGVDRETGEKLSVENIRFQMSTFLSAGYETTSATLSFVYYFLCDNPDVLLKAQQEVDDVVGDKVITASMLPKLDYIDACIKESLRVMPPINLFNRTATKDTTLAGKYFIKKGQLVTGLLKQFHRDPKIWGEDADEFRPDRMANGRFQKLPPNSWKAFGDGLRACIGSGFAQQEMLINIAMVLQRFQIEKADPNYKLTIKSTLSVKPGNFKMRVRRRPGRTLMTGIPGGAPAESARRHREQHDKVNQPKLGDKRVTVFFAGNTGTCESLAQSLAKDAPDYGLNIDIRNLDAATEYLPTDRPCVIITPSYEGRPADNAKKFVAWIEQLSMKSQKLPPGIHYAVFGVGNSDWASTFHRIPRLVDQTLAQLGAERIMEAGFANVKQDLIGPWEDWSEQILSTLSDSTSRTRRTQAGVEVRIENNKLSQMLGGDEMAAGTVVANIELADTSVGAAKRHVEIRLPPGCDYTSGDYLVIQGRNPEETVRRVMARFGLTEHDVMSVQESKKNFLPSQPMAVDHFLYSSVELASPVTKRQLAALASLAETGSAERKQLEEMQGDSKYQEILEKRYSVLDVLEEVPSLRVPFGVYIDFLLPLTPRQYSISSSSLEPRNNAGGGNTEHIVTASVTFDVFDSPATSGHGTFRGVVSNYLANCKPGDRIPCFVMPTNVGFRLPTNPETPVIMLAAGTGIAPMRAFLQERAAIKRAGVRKLGPAVLFFGCRHPDKDFIYRAELADWESEGIVEVIPCFSKPDNGQRGRHVPDVLWEHRKRVWEMFRDGGKIYLCGSASKLGRSSASMCRRIWRENTGKSEQESDEWFEEVKNTRYVSDVY
ncbi:cytochrome P450 [Hypomontagnella monticulosa]|nr:cytochrome P450 [Hypomontagnella monticulosa]